MRYTSCVLSAGGTVSQRVLVIDDEDAARYGMVRALSGEGYEVRDTGDSQGAIDLIDTFRPDVVLSDINMPEFKRRLSQQAEVCRQQNVPIWLRQDLW